MSVIPTDFSFRPRKIVRRSHKPIIVQGKHHSDQPPHHTTPHRTQPCLENHLEVVNGGTPTYISIHVGSSKMEAVTSRAVISFQSPAPASRLPLPCIRMRGSTGVASKIQLDNPVRKSNEKTPMIRVVAALFSGIPLAPSLLVQHLGCNGIHIARFGFPWARIFKGREICLLGVFCLGVNNATRLFLSMNNADFYLARSLALNHSNFR